MRVLGLRFSKGDIDGLLGIFVDNLSVFLVLISLNLYVVGMPAEIVFGRMLPGAALGLLFGNVYYAYLAKRLAAKEQRDDVTALPSGVSIVFVLVYTLGILLPVAKITGDPVMAWRIGLAANFIGALICVIGAFIGPWLRKHLPTSAMLGALAGLAVVFIAGMGLDDIFSDPIIGFVALAVVLWGYIARGKIPFKLPAGLVALILGAIIAIFMGKASLSLDGVGFYAPIPWFFSVGFQAFREATPFLAVIIPLAVINFISTLNNVESANTAGDNYPIRETMIVDAIASALGGLFGCPYPNCVFIGHPGYKRMGARMGYSLLNGIIMTVLALFGLFGFMSKIIPTSAVTPILIFIGLVNIELAFTAVPKAHIPASAIALLPFVGEFAFEQVNSALAAVGKSAADPEVFQGLMIEGLNYPGYTVLAYGTIIISMLLASILAFVISRDMAKAAGAAAIGALCSLVGLIHSSTLAWLPVPQLTLAWTLIAAILFVMYLYGKSHPEALQPIE
jgi:AGZA family xanthine/uracil permease-like MFS transporter